MKKILGVLLGVILLLASMAYAENQLTSGDFIYELLNDGTVRILKYTGDFKKDIHIPTFIDGYQVTVIGKEAFSCEDREFPSGHEDIIVTLPDSITTLEEKAFYHARVKQINIPANVTVIKPGALRMASSVTYNLSKGNSKYALIEGNLYDKQKKEFLSWCGAQKVNVPNGIKSIAPYAFSSAMRPDCYVTLPDSVSLIGAYAFKNVYLNSENGSLHFKGVKSIGEGAFYNTVFLASFILPTSVTNIPEYAFANAELNDGFRAYLRGSRFVWHDQVESIGAHAFENAYLYSSYETDDNSTRLTRLPEQLEEIGEFAFKDSSLFGERIALSEQLIVIGDCAFQTRITDSYGYTVYNTPREVVLPSELYGLGDNVFNEDVTLIVEEGSYAETYARNEGYTYIYANPTEDDLSWLTE